MHGQGNSQTGRQESGPTDTQTATDEHAIRQSTPQEAVRRTTARQHNPCPIQNQGDTTGFTNAMRQSLRIPTTTTIRDRHDLD